MKIDDASTAALGRLFGDWIFGGKLETSLSAFLSVIGVAGLVLYTILILYVAIAGLMKASTRGGVRGWHPTWVPFRLGVSLLFILPLYSGAHWGGAQVGMLAVAEKGSQLATWAASRTVGLDLGNRAALAGETDMVVPNLVTAQRFVDRSLAAITCLDAHNRLDNPRDLHPGAPGYRHWLAIVTEECGVQLAYFDSEHPWSTADSNRQADANAGLPWASSPASGASAELLDTLNRKLINYNARWFSWLTGFYSQAMATTDPLSSRLERLRRKALADYYNGLQTALTEAMRDYRKQAGERYVEDLGRRGWFSIFTRQADIARIGQLAQDLVNQRVADMTPKPPKLPSVSRPDLQISYEISRQTRAMRISNEAWYDSLARGLTGRSADENAQQFADWLSGALGIRPLLEARAGRVDPLVAATQSGSTLAQLGAMALAGSLSADIANALPSGILKLINRASLLILLIGLGFLLLGALPLLYGAAAILRWLTHVIEGLVAAPLWAAAHAAPEGDDHTSRLAAKGYNNVLFIFLFPVLAVGGVFAATQLGRVAAPLLLDLVFSGVQSGNANSVLIAPVQFVVVLVLSMVILGITLIGSWSLVDSLPSAVLNWISTAAPGLTPFGERGERHAHGVVAWIRTQAARARAGGGSLRSPLGRSLPGAARHGIRRDQGRH